MSKVTEDDIDEDILTVHRENSDCATRDELYTALPLYEQSSIDQRVRALITAGMLVRGAGKLTALSPKAQTMKPAAPKPKVDPTVATMAYMRTHLVADRADLIMKCGATVQLIDELVKEKKLHFTDKGNVGQVALGPATMPQGKSSAKQRAWNNDVPPRDDKSAATETPVAEAPASGATQEAPAPADVPARAVLVLDGLLTDKEEAAVRLTRAEYGGDVVQIDGFDDFTEDGGGGAYVKTVRFDADGEIVAVGKDYIERDVAIQPTAPAEPEVSGVGLAHELNPGPIILKPALTIGDVMDCERMKRGKAPVEFDYTHEGVRIFIAGPRDKALRAIRHMLNWLS